MDANDAARLEHIRRWVRPDWERWLRPDWERYVHPAGHEAVRKEMEPYRRAFETPRMRAERQRAEEAALERKQREIEWDARDAALKRKADIAWERFTTALRALLSQKAGFNPDQPRDELGRWTDSGQGMSSGINDSRILSDATPDDDWMPGAQYAANTGRRPPTLGHNNPPKDIPPERPEDPSARTRAIRAAGKILEKISHPVARAAALLTILEGAPWLRGRQAEIETQLDPPKTLEELQKAVRVARPGTHVHHIVERSAEGDGISQAKINAPNNLVRIPKQIHEKITQWYSTKNVDYGDQAPRDWLRGKSWDERRALGIKKLVDFGALKK
jgi:hypothetical protein